MFRKENLAAVSLVWVLFSLVVGYAFAEFLAPSKTMTSAGFLGFSTEEVPFFNWRAFLLGFSVVQLGMPLLHLLQRQWGWATAELMVLGGTGLLCMQLAPLFTGSEVQSAPLGFNPVETVSFRTDLLLVTICAVWGLYSCGRLIFESKDAEGNWLEAPSMRLGLLVVGWGAAICYFIGIHIPVFHSTKFYFFEDEVTLVQSIAAFFKAGEMFIGVVVLVFTLVFPVIKLAYMFWMTLSVPSPWSLKVNKVLAILGKYSMLDVFVLALLLLNLKFDSKILDMTLESGVIWFTVSILLNMGVTSFLVFRRVKSRKAEEELSI